MAWSSVALSRVELVQVKLNARYLATPQHCDGIRKTEQTVNLFGRLLEALLTTSRAVQALACPHTAALTGSPNRLGLANTAQLETPMQRSRTTE